MTNDRYAELRAALDAGPTPGPWRQYQTLVCAGTIGIESSGDDIVLEPTRGISLTDARYIAACHPEAILALLAERDALREALDQCRFALEPYDDVKPRDWVTDREKLRRAHQVAIAALAQEQGGSDG